jgi:hypothetical protein
MFIETITSGTAQLLLSREHMSFTKGRILMTPGGPEGEMQLAQRLELGLRQCVRTGRIGTFGKSLMF